MVVVYECPGCGERLLERRYPDCNLFCKWLGRGVRGPCCHEAVSAEELG